MVLEWLDEVIGRLEEQDDHDDSDDKISILQSPVPERTYTYRYRAETSPTSRLPGYIPGMPRPITTTPREVKFDPDELPTSFSSTPRALSPRINSTDRATSPSFPSNSPGLSLDTIGPKMFQQAWNLPQRDREQRASYQQYLTRSPTSPLEAATLSPRQPRPISLSIGGNLSGDGTGLVPELSIIRVFAGKRLQTEATFTTVKLNPSTTSEELVKQAIQRFRLPVLGDTVDYYLTAKLLEGTSATLLPEEKPLVVFQTLADAVKRISVGGIRFMTSDLSPHAGVKRPPMNDFTDTNETAVKIYLNRRSYFGSEDEESATAEEGDTVGNSPSWRDGLRNSLYILEDGSSSSSSLDTIGPINHENPQLRPYPSSTTLQSNGSVYNASFVTSPSHDSLID